MRTLLYPDLTSIFVKMDAPFNWSTKVDTRGSVMTMTSDHPVPYCPIASMCSLSVYSMYSPCPFLSICLVAPPISEACCLTCLSVRLLNMFSFSFPVTIRSRPVPLLIQYSSVIQLSHLLYLLRAQRDCARCSSVIPTSHTSPHPFYLV